MKNNKGFTLMELLVAVFIAGMVTIALMTIWKASSVQTSQGQRQSIIRNNLSIFMRALHRDITEADLILAPTSDDAEGTQIVVARNAYLDTSGNVAPNLLSYSSDTGGTKIESDPIVVSYCLEGGNILREQTSLSSATAVSDLLTCGGRVYMADVDTFNISTSNNLDYRVQVVVTKVFENSETPPIHIEIDKTFSKAGGI